MSFKPINRINRSGTENDGPLLPRDIFSSKLSYILFTHKAFSLTLTCELLIIGFLLCSIVRSNDAIFGTLLLGSVVMILTGSLAYAATRNVGMTKTNQLSFLKEVTIVKPGLDNGKWNTIASNLNPVFFENCASATPYFFYDGEACASVFTRYYLEPYYWNKAWNERGKGQRGELSGEQVESGESQAAPAQLRWNAYSELSPFIEEAVLAYQENLETHWNEMMNGRSSV